MSLSKTQRDIVWKFFQKHLPDQPVFGGIYTQNQDVKYLGLNYNTATQLAQSLVEGLIREKPKISYRQFEKEMLYRIRKINYFVERDANRLARLSHGNGIKPNGKHNSQGVKMIASYFNNLSIYRVAFKNQLNSYRFMSKIANSWANAVPRKFGNFLVRNSFYVHQEAPLGMIIESKQGQKLGTLGGFIEYKNRKPEVHITNVQGLKSTELDKETLSTPHKRLNEALGENWRVFFTKQIVNAAKAKGYNVTGWPPLRFVRPSGNYLSTDSEFKRQQRQAKQTFKKSGLNEEKLTESNQKLSKKFTLQKPPSKTSINPKPISKRKKKKASKGMLLSKKPKKPKRTRRR